MCRTEVHTWMCMSCAWENHSPLGSWCAVALSVFLLHNCVRRVDERVRYECALLLLLLSLLFPSMHWATLKILAMACAFYCLCLVRERNNGTTNRWKESRKKNTQQHWMLIRLYQECAVMMWLRRHCANKLDEHSLVGIVRSDRHNVLTLVLLLMLHENTRYESAIYFSVQRYIRENQEQPKGTVASEYWILFWAVD